MASQVRVRAGVPQKVLIPQKKRSLFAAAYELLFHVFYIDPAIVAVALVAFAWRRQ